MFIVSTLKHENVAFLCLYRISTVQALKRDADTTVESETEIGEAKVDTDQEVEIVMTTTRDEDQSLNIAVSITPHRIIPNMKHAILALKSTRSTNADLTPLPHLRVDNAAIDPETEPAEKKALDLSLMQGI